MPVDRRALGRWAEQRAVEHLQRAGYTLLERNWVGAYGELDLIARHADTLVVVEVRSRRNAFVGAAEASITPTKAQRLITLTYEYLQSLSANGTPWLGPFRIDIIAIAINRSGRVEYLNHLEAAVGE